MKATLRLEYEEINRWLRQIELGWWAVGSVLAAMIGALMRDHFSVFESDVRTEDIAIWAFLLFMLWLYLCFTKYAYRQSKSYSSRAKQIEKELGMEFFLKAKERFNSGEKYGLLDFFSSKAPDNSQKAPDNSQKVPDNSQKAPDNSVEASGKSGTLFLPELNFAGFISVITITMTIAWFGIVLRQVLIHFGFLQSIYKCVGAIPH